MEVSTVIATRKDRSARVASGASVCDRISLTRVRRHSNFESVGAGRYLGSREALVSGVAAFYDHLDRCISATIAGICNTSDRDRVSSAFLYVPTLYAVSDWSRNARGAGGNNIYNLTCSYISSLGIVTKQK